MRILEKEEKIKTAVVLVVGIIMGILIGVMLSRYVLAGQIGWMA